MILSVYRGSSDYVGLNHYTSYLIRRVQKKPNEKWENDRGYKILSHTNWKKSAIPVYKVSRKDSIL